MLSVGELRKIRLRCFRLERLRQSEVQHLHFSVRRDLHIRGLQIPMDDSFLVRRLQRFADLLRNPERFIDRNRPSLDALGQRFSIDEFHHQELASAGFFQSVDGRNVGMIQRCQHARFALESRHAFAIVS